METEPKYNTGFDRGIDFKEMKGQLVDSFNTINKLLDNVPEDTKRKHTKRILINKLIYILTAMIQLYNGSRIIEACSSFKKFIADGNIEQRILIKLAKSETIKYNKDGEETKTKIRFRKIEFPLKWINGPLDRLDDLRQYLDLISIDVLRKRVLGYLLKFYNCNTHSLRYAYINHMIYEQGKEPALVAKHVGHSNLNQLIRYTQNKQADKLFDIDI